MTETNIKKSDNIVLNDAITQIGAFSSGTLEKFIIVNELLSGKKTVPDIQEKLPEIGKSTLYKYIGDLETAGILEKDEKGSKIFYTLAGFSLVLTPKRISEMLGGSKEDEEKRFNDMFKFDPKINIIDRQNHPGEFYSSVLLSDMISCGIKMSVAVDILRDVMENLYDGITTREISSITRRMIEKRSNALAIDYKKYILGPVNVETDEGIKLWDNEMIEKEIRQRHNIVDIPQPELIRLAHRIGRQLKKIGKIIPENLAHSYIDYVVLSYINAR
ncbi:MAG: hypothetical protein CVT88_03615 [Candidatus Altiarchaeales archaeon HGW-Altiarchaeales-1]|nr:MAG: hypothetical protein CVT89_02020 [Candidatus Altiarchaeales archaeon HGW-Altiarchaeales-2]PKP60203.1 MAG: hypothetical protein CVT88_03615 [Candidatus Altiarchaeales archaeon HGW-Altiarchaeales-1]